MAKRRNVMKEFRLDEISAVDRPAQVGAKAVIMKRRELAKRLAMTTMADGHAHLVVGMSGGDGRLAEVRAGQTSFQDGHAHDWFMDDAGNVVIGDANGHTHGIAAMVTKGADGLEIEDLEPYWKREFSSKERESLAESGAAMPDGSFPISTRKDLEKALQAFGQGGAAVARHIGDRAAKLDLTELLPKEGPLADLLTKGTDGEQDDKAAEAIGSSNRSHEMTKNEKTAADDQAVEKQELENLRKRNERLEKVAELNDTERAYFKGLSEEDQDKFLAKDSSGREAEIRKADEANEVVFTDEETGEVYRKNDDPRLVSLAKRTADERKKRKDMEEKAKAAELEKLSAELDCLPGEEKDRKALLKSVLNLPGDERESALKSLRAQDKALRKSAFQTLGSRSQPKTDGSPESELDEIAKGIREKDPSLTEAQAMVKAMETPEGQRLYAKHIGLDD